MPSRRLIFIALLLFFVVTADASCAELAAKAADRIISAFSNAAADWERHILAFGTRLFYLLAVISLVWMFIQGILSGARSLSDLFAPLCQWIITTGFFYALLHYGVFLSTEIGGTFGGDVIDTFIEVGVKAINVSGSNVNSASPGTIITSILQAAMDIYLNVSIGYGNAIYERVTSWSGIFSSTTGRLVVVGILAVLVSEVTCVITVMIAAKVALALVGCYFASYTGQLLLGFGGAEFTRPMTIAYLKKMVGIGLQVMTTLLIAGIVTTRIAKATHYAFLYASLASTKPESISIAPVMLTLIVALVGYLLIGYVPEMVAGLVGGGLPPAAPRPYAAAAYAAGFISAPALKAAIYTPGAVGRAPLYPIAWVAEKTGTAPGKAVAGAIWEKLHNQRGFFRQAAGGIAGGIANAWNDRRNPQKTTTYQADIEEAAKNAAAVISDGQGSPAANVAKASEQYQTAVEKAALKEASSIVDYAQKIVENNDSTIVTKGKTAENLKKAVEYADDYIDKFGKMAGKTDKEIAALKDEVGKTVDDLKHLLTDKGTPPERAECQEKSKKDIAKEHNKAVAKLLHDLRKTMKKVIPGVQETPPTTGSGK